MLQAVIKSKGQATIPRGIRDALHLSAGDKVGFILSGEREASIRPISKSASYVFGILSGLVKKAHTIEEMDTELKEAFKQGKI
jgi:AbrB family looped-hinge helix DNA binding protein